MLVQNKFFKICLGIILLLLIIFLTSKVSFVFKPVYLMFNLLIIPFILSVFLYYLIRPLVDFLTKQKVNKMVAILFIFFLMLAFTIIFLAMVWPTLQTQVKNFMDGTPQLIQGFQNQFHRMQQNRIFSMFFKNESDLSRQLSEYLSSGITAASNYVANAISLVTSFVIIVATVPILLYYMLKESEKLPASCLLILPRRYRNDGKEVLEEIDSALSGFIVGRVIITGLLGVMMFIGFLLIGLPFALLIAVVSMLLNLIPYIGSILGAIPVLIVAFTSSSTMVIWALVVVLITQQAESTLLSPHIYGKRLDMHPLTTIIILLVSGDIAGILGVILAIPLYMVAKIVIVRVYSIFLEDKMEEFVD